MTFGKSYSTQIKKVNILILSMLLLWSALLPTTVQAFSAPGYTWTLFNGGEGFSAGTSQYPSAYLPDTVIFNDELYAIWQERSMTSYTDEIRVMKWTGAEWLPADGGVALNYDETHAAQTPALAVYNDQLYAIWIENDGIRVKKLVDGSWVTADNGIALNGPVGMRDGRTPTMIAHDGYLYAAWIEGPNPFKHNVKKYDGENWTTELEDFSFKPNGRAWQPSFGIYNDELYITWSEQLYAEPYHYYLPVFKRSGNASWTNVSGEYGINNDPTIGGGTPVLAEYDGKLIAVWRTYNIAKFRIQSYDGTGWSDVGDGLVPTLAGESPQNVQLTTFRNKLYIAWVGYNPSSYPMKHRVQYYDGTSYTLVNDGLENSGSNGMNSSLAVNDQSLYMVWSDSNKIYGAMYRAAPDAPIGLQASVTSNSVTLSWNTDIGVENYSIYMGTSSQSYDPAPIATVDGAIGTYTVNNLNPNQMYYFAVRASNVDGISQFSSEVNAFIAPVPAPILQGFSLVPGSEVGTTMVTTLEDMSASYRYVVAAADGYHQPMVGSNATDLGYVSLVSLNSNIAVESGQHMYIVEVDQSEKILKWVDIEILDEHIQQELTPEPTENPEQDLIKKATLNYACNIQWYDHSTELTEFCDYDSLQTGIYYDGEHMQSILAFELPETDKAIASAKLKFFVTQKFEEMSDSISLNILKGASDWHPDSNEIPATTISVGPFTISDMPSWYEFDITSLVQNSMDQQEQQIVLVTEASIGESTYGWFNYLNIPMAELVPVLELSLSELTPGPTPQPTPEPTVAPTTEPTAEPTVAPTAEPTAEPTVAPTAEPTVAPTAEPTVAPTAEPTTAPTVAPTTAPTVAPTTAPTVAPTTEPTVEPTVAPTVEPTVAPTVEPTVAPTVEPTVAPTVEPTVAPTVEPTVAPTVEPTVAPTVEPTVAPTVEPTVAPTTVPTAKPTQKPTPMPTASTSNSEQNSLVIDVDGNEQAQIATAQMKTENGKAVMHITFDETKLKQLVADQSSDIVITLPSNQSSNTVIGTLNGQTIKMMEKSTLRIATEFGSYTLPLDQIHISSLSEQLGSEMKYSDVEINIQLELQSDNNVAIQHTSDHMEIIAPVVDFRITAAYGDRKVEIAEFDNYVERMIAIPEGVDPSKITTGIVILENGEVHHIPTRVTQVDGVYYAIINSMFNSNYSVIYNEKTFDDISGHWAQKSIENLASRLVLQGVTSNQYEPNQNITRAEFAAILVRALGLYQSNEKTAYADMEQEAWYSDVVSIATSYSLMNGFPDGRFNPEQNVTREEAMVAIARAVALIKAEADLQPSEQQTANLTQFSDAGVISQWAEPAVALNVSNGIVQGSGQSLRPLANLSRAELAVMIERLLRQVNLI